MFKSTYGTTTKEPDGRTTGHIMYVYSPPRRDGKIKVMHSFVGSGKSFTNICTPDQLREQIAKYFPNEI